jgi:hypothetical protein
MALAPTSQSWYYEFSQNEENLKPLGRVLRATQQARVSKEHEPAVWSIRIKNWPSKIPLVVDSCVRGSEDNGSIFERILQTEGAHATLFFQQLSHTNDRYDAVGGESH